VSKVGFVLPSSVFSPTESLQDVPFYAKISETSYHSIHPSYLSAQITASLERLQLDKLDIFILNNPKRMLDDKHLPAGYTKTRLYMEIAEAFVHLDKEVAKGRIGGYGICSNALYLPTTDDHLSLKTIMKSRPDYGWELDNFVAIEAPLNLFEPELVADILLKSLAHEAKVKKKRQALRENVKVVLLWMLTHDDLFAASIYIT
jgi:aryl-alcohol dehydrogenase-like predicted oxidoreductase